MLLLVFRVSSARLAWLLPLHTPAPRTSNRKTDTFCSTCNVIRAGRNSSKALRQTSFSCHIVTLCHCDYFSNSHPAARPESGTQRPQRDLPTDAAAKRFNCDTKAVASHIKYATAGWKDSLSASARCSSTRTTVVQHGLDPAWRRFPSQDATSAHRCTTWHELSKLHSLPTDAHAPTMNPSHALAISAA